MSTTIDKMTKEELVELIEGVIEKKLIELIGDPDDGLEIREKIRKRLLQQKEDVKSGNRGKLFEDVVAQLGLE